MAETSNGAAGNAQDEVKTPGKIVSSGEITPAKIPINYNKGADTSTDVADPDKKDETGKNGEENVDKKDKQGGDPPANEPDIEAVKKMFKDKGIEFDGNFDALKEKLTPKEEVKELTPEEKAKAEADLDKRMLNHFIANGGSAESYVTLKKIASSDLRDLSVAQIREEMKAAEFDEKEIEQIIAERYYQIKVDELEQLVDETDEDFEKRKADLTKKMTYGSKKLESRGIAIKKEAESLINGLKSSLEAQDLLAQKEVEFSSKVDDAIKSLPRKVTFEIGEIDGKPVDPISYDVNDADLEEIAAVLKDPEKRNQFFYNPDNSLNLTNVLSVMAESKYLKSALKAAYSDGSSRQVAIFEKVFPGSAHDLGVGGQTGGTKGRKGVFATAGKPEPMPVKR